MDIQQTNPPSGPYQPPMQQPAPMANSPHRWGMLGIVALLAVAIAAVGYFLIKNSYDNYVAAPSYTPRVSYVAGPGEHCGGNMTTAKSCSTGYTCTPVAGSHLPFGDVGGTCVQSGGDTTGWKTYTSQLLGISFQYPSDWSVKEGNDYPGSAQGENYVKITKGTDLIYAGTKTECLAGYTYCKRANPSPSFSTTSSNAAVKTIIDTIVASVTHL